MDGDNDGVIDAEVRSTFGPNGDVETLKLNGKRSWHPQAADRATPPADDKPEAFLGQSLLERAGMARRADKDASKRYDVLNNEAGQIKDRNKPV